METGIDQRRGCERRLEKGFGIKFNGDLDSAKIIPLPNFGGFRSRWAGYIA
jgi:hypothetical protein